MHGVDELPALLPAAEIVILITPLNDATRGMVNADFLARLPDGALVVNVARGPVVDTDALLAELRSGRLRAALDVVDPEPLPADHPLWDAPGLCLVPTWAAARKPSNHAWPPTCANRYAASPTGNRFRIWSTRQSRLKPPQAG